MSPAISAEFSVLSGSEARTTFLRQRPLLQPEVRQAPGTQTTRSSQIAQATQQIGVNGV